MNIVAQLLAHMHDSATTEEDRRFAAETAAMVGRMIAWKRLVKSCPHDGGWMHVGAAYIQCQSCGLVAPMEGWQKFIRWSEPEVENEAMGTALVAWSGAKP